MIEKTAKFGYICFFVIIIFAFIDFQVNVNTGNIKSVDSQGNETMVTKDSIDKTFNQERNR